MKQQNSEQLLKQIHSYIEQLPFSHEPLGLYDPIFRMCWLWEGNAFVRC